MKHCPECNASFPDTDQFCELDGTTLVADYSNRNPEVAVPPADWSPQTGNQPGLGAVGYQVSRDGPFQQDWKILAIVAIAGVAISLVLFVVYQRMAREVPGQSSTEPASNEALTQQQIPLLTLRPSPLVSASPSPEASPSPSAMPSPVVQAESAKRPGGARSQFGSTTVLALKRMKCGKQEKESGIGAAALSLFWSASK